MPTEAKVMRSYGAGITGSYEPSDLVLGTHLWSFAGASHALRP